MSNEPSNGSSHNPSSRKSVPVRFIGTFFPKVASGTSQVVLPKALKKAVDEGDEGHLILVPRHDKHYWQVMTEQVFNKLVEDTKNNPNAPEKSRKSAAGKLASSAFHVELDTQNRFSLPKGFTDKLVESNDLVFESVHTYVKLWAKTDYDRENAQQETEYKAVMNDALDNL